MERNPLEFFPLLCDAKRIKRRMTSEPLAVGETQGSRAFCVTTIPPLSAVAGQLSSIFQGRGRGWRVLWKGAYGVCIFSGQFQMGRGDGMEWDEWTGKVRLRNCFFKRRRNMLYVLRENPSLFLFFGERRWGRFFIIHGMGREWDMACYEHAGTCPTKCSLFGSIPREIMQKPSIRLANGIGAQHALYFSIWYTAIGLLLSRSLMIKLKCAPRDYVSVCTPPMEKEK
ncbi:hypothetical protein BS50DRAFT_210032 [Corynespora cassiicola Philippines]|uniref:Uncharacterized protein n=1 Tax=Corynespora cassiicola Philippines TaxID=1448308 RepID=A0A2T2N4S7_CORCC|nr:hypothetical protein BS50DRAFT_210032 [Corynespora cassiicola Philippines]